MKATVTSPKASSSHDRKTKSDSDVVNALNLFLADSYALMANTHHAHWNVEGQEFFSLHHAFQKQYEHLFEAVDEIAERVRALDAFPIGGLRALAKQADIDEFPDGAVAARDFVSGLIIGHEKAVTDGVALRAAAAVADDLETQDLAIKRVQWHQKTLWMLKSFLKAH